MPEILDRARARVLADGAGLDEDEILQVLRLPDDDLPELLQLAHEVRMAWCGPPARWADHRRVSASRAAASVAPLERGERSTIASDHGKPISRCCESLSVPSLYSR